MRQRIFIVLLLVGFIVPALALAEGVSSGHRYQHGVEIKEPRQKQKEEKKEFRKSLDGKPAQEKKEAIASRNEPQYQKTKVFNQKTHGENLTFLKERLADNKKLTDAQKSALINYFENQFQENVSFRGQQHQENVAFFEQIANSPNMTQEQKKAAIKSHIESQKQENKEQPTIK